MTLVTYIKTAVIAAVLLLMWRNVNLSNEVDELTAEKDALSSLLIQKQQENDSLSGRIDALVEKQHQTQFDMDNALATEKKRAGKLSQQVQQLEQELERESCYDEPIKYPDTWVSGYPNHYPI
ncbi:hypothetical protein [Vibrio scophthalmi]|uniref:Uncharacterized protein n=1 Tax=Vibrio scophthalmi TaxID=45658 RepID=A0A1E3WJ19_9VIBR|nr:hypothetical protein [Vibrio scophthalmi]ODS09766.1 hypothetical protein VSF3289_03228 [Vibrio scophthalmi]